MSVNLQKDLLVQHCTEHLTGEQRGLPEGKLSVLRGEAAVPQLSGPNLRTSRKEQREVACCHLCHFRQRIVSLDRSH